MTDDEKKKKKWEKGQKQSESSGAIVDTLKEMNPMNDDMRDAFSKTIGDASESGSSGGSLPEDLSGRINWKTTPAKQKIAENTSPLSDADLDYQKKLAAIKKKYG